MMPESAITMSESAITMPGIADHHAGTGDHDGLELAITFDWNARSQWAGLRRITRPPSWACGHRLDLSQQQLVATVGAATKAVAYPVENRIVSVIGGRPCGIRGQAILILRIGSILD